MACLKVVLRLQVSLRENHKVCIKLSSHYTLLSWDRENYPIITFPIFFMFALTIVIFFTLNSEKVHLHMGKNNVTLMKKCFEYTKQMKLNRIK